jgi:alpha-L-fucosidase 2
MQILRYLVELRSIRRWSFVLLLGALSAAFGQEQTTAWKDGHFQIDAKGIVSRSDVVLLRPNTQKTQAMPLGNGRLGLGVWAEGGYTAQLNREDTWPFRLSPGHVVLQGLRKLSEASDYSARLDLFNGEFIEKGDGMTAITYVDDKYDVMVVEVTGADPNSVQEADLKLWPGRKPEVLVADGTGALSETWRDTNEMGASGLTYGSLSGIRIDGREPRASADGQFGVKLLFSPKSDGSFRVLVASPEWRGGDAMGEVSSLLNKAGILDANDHREWWHRFWGKAALIKMSSPDRTAEYFENLRMIDLFVTAAENRDRFPGNQAGIGDLFSSFGDDHHWGPSAYWHWNLRMQISANLGAGLAEFNEPYFNLYNDNMDSVSKWTREHVGGRRGLCVPETMRFNGPGYENETWLKSPGINCTEDGRPYYNARTLSTGAEVSLWIWQQYLYTDDKTFLESHYPFMRESARFLLAYAKRDNNGKLYTYPSNAHESNWDVRNPTTDVAAMQALFPVVVEAAKTLGIQDDDDLVPKLKAAIKDVPALPVRLVDSTKLLKSLDNNNPHTVIANSYTDDAIRHNEENLGLEPVWPYGIIGDDGPLHALGVRTFMNRPNKAAADWSADPVQAARLGLGEEMKSTMMKVTERYQFYPSGLAQLTEYPEFYVEQVGVVADAIQNGLVQDYDGVVRIKPAWPSDWNADGTVVVRHGNRINIQVRAGKIVTLGLDAARQSEIKLRNPWPGQTLRVERADHQDLLIMQTSDAIVTIPLQAGSSYLVVPDVNTEAKLQFSAIRGEPATQPKKLGSRTIGLDRDSEGKKQ